MIANDERSVRRLRVRLLKRGTVFPPLGAKTTWWRQA
jgi:hypothetical protein